MEPGSNLKCRSCAAPVAYVTGETVVTCSYCGCTVILHDDPSAVVKVQAHTLVANRTQPATLEPTLTGWLAERLLAPRDLVRRARVTATEGRCLPYWIVAADCTTRWTGYDVAEHVEHVGDETKRRREYEPRDGTFATSHRWPVYARRTEEFWGQAALKPGGPKVTPDWGGYPFGFLGFQRSGDADLAAGRTPFHVADVPAQMKLLNGQIDQTQAESAARQELDLHCWRLAKERVHTLHECGTTATVRDVELVHVPFWWVTWTYRGASYHALAHGGTGELLAVEYPVGRPAKVAITLVLAALLTLAVVFGLAASWWRTALLVALWGTALAHLALELWDDLTDDEDEAA